MQADSYKWLLAIALVVAFFPLRIIASTVGNETDIWTDVDDQLFFKINNIGHVSAGENDSLLSSNEGTIMAFYLNMLTQDPSLKGIASSDLKFLIETSCIVENLLYKLEYNSVEKFIHTSIASAHNMEELSDYNNGMPVSLNQMAALKKYIKYKANAAVKKQLDANNLTGSPNNLSENDIQNILDRSISDSVFDSQVKYILKYPKIVY